MTIVHQVIVLVNVFGAKNAAVDDVKMTCVLFVRRELGTTTLCVNCLLTMPEHHIMGLRAKLTIDLYC
ncbi:hypothetical protein T4D_4295 [Trichinella pseudospiralis]|uniref:Uncharacterized protein n=1 Tax=Trichinella pseudospiralis TaxID=6337 RepID=A0A0V1FRH1_TRIPS|nr:hypothetical protein T4D_4295 [Trichinella pseudospiralis]